MNPVTKVDPEELAERDKLLEYLNGVKITKKDFIKVIEECERRHSGDDWEPGDGMYVIAMMFRRKPQKCQAIFFRIDAMNDLLVAGAIPGYWAFTPQRGWSNTNQGSRACSSGIRTTHLC